VIYVALLSLLTFWSSIPLCNYIRGELLYITVLHSKVKIYIQTNVFAINMLYFLKEGYMFRQHCHHQAYTR
jgi:hypothetical protein